MSTLSPSAICLPPISVSSVAVRRKWAKAGYIRRASSTAPGISEGSSTSIFIWSGCSSRARMPLV